MSAHTAQMLPPKMATQFAERARNGEGVPVGDIAVEFPQHGSVVCVMYPHDDRVMGHITRNPRRADELRAIIAARVQS
jgi:hypothetical protein